MSLVALRTSRSGRAAGGHDLKAFLPTTREEMRARGWDELDVLVVTGDAYVDHPAFGPVLVARFLEGRGFRVGIVAQPRWDRPDDLARMGRPRLFVGVTAGNLDSMLNKLTAQKKVRSEDQYSPGGRSDMRPNRASIVYANLCRQAFSGLLVFGMGERPAWEIARRLAAGEPVASLTDVRGTAHRAKNRRAWEPLAADP